MSGLSVVHGFPEFTAGTVIAVLFSDSQRQAPHTPGHSNPGWFDGSPVQLIPIAPHERFAHHRQTETLYVKVSGRRAACLQVYVTMRWKPGRHRIGQV